MKKLSLLIVLLCVSFVTIAQDVIVKKDGSTIQSKGMEINETEIKYKKWSNQDGPLYSISRSEIMSISYENGEVEKFSENPNDTSDYNNHEQSQSHFKGAMNPKGTLGYLAINGYKLSDEQVQNLVDPQSYQLYRKAKRQKNAGLILVCIGLASATVGAGSLIAGKTDVAGVTISIGVVTTVPGAFLLMSSGNKTKKIAHEYNKKNGYYSFNLSPSMIRYEIPQSQTNCGFGLTVSMNF